VSDEDRLRTQFDAELLSHTVREMTCEGHQLGGRGVAAVD
jgi:hypothetical protein